MTGEDIHVWQQGVADRGFAIGVDTTFGPESDRVCRQFQARFGLKVDGIVGPITWPATFAYPTLADATSALSVELATPDATDPASGATLADSTGTNRIFIEVHSRSVHEFDPADVIVTLLFADASGAVPALPPGYAGRISGRDTGSWLAGSGWTFALPAAPYAPIARQLRAAAPQVAEFLVDFSTLALPSKSLIAAAFTSTASNADQLVNADTNVTTLTRGDRHVSAKLLKLIP